MKTFNQPDLNAPRFRPKWKKVMSKSLFEEFKSHFPEHAHIDYDQFKEVIKTFNENMIQGVINNRYGIELPERLGALFIVNCTWGKNEGINNIDFGKSRELGVVVTHQNWESDNKLMKIIYSNHDNRFRIANKKIWQFRLSKPNRKVVSEGYKERPNRYITVDDKKKISGVFKDMERRNSKFNSKPNIPDDYDEFNMD